MNKSQLTEWIRERRSYLCVGLDSDMSLIPRHLLSEADPIFAFNRAIIDATAEYCVAFKPNTAFYESQGSRGWESLQRTAEYIGDQHFRIADAKRGDIGNTANRYASAFFEQMPFDALTIAPYMGRDSVTPFLAHPEKWAILLALTSNPGSADFQFLTLEGQPLYERVVQSALQWPDAERLMFVVGATHEEHFGQLRKMAPDHFFLVPGVGAQGGDLRSLSLSGLNKDGGLLVNSSRSIIYASGGKDFDRAAGAAAKALQEEMARLLEESSLL